MRARDDLAEGPRTRALLIRRRRRRRHALMLAAVLLVGAALTATLGVVYLQRGDPPAPAAAAGDGRSSGAPAPLPAPDGPTPSYPVSGPNTFTYAAGTDQVLGAGTAAVKNYRVAVENASGQDLAAFADAVRRVLADQRGWTAGGDVRFQQAAKDAPTVHLTFLLATQGTAEKICSLGGVHTDQFTSCRLPGQLVINLTRWLTAIPGYGAPLAEYQAYEINYAVGRELGHPNESCPNPGRPAPVMQKQALGLKGCTPYGWPYRDGARYNGPPLP